MPSGTLQTEFEFTLPKGYVDDQGRRHRRGVMRLATAVDEIAPLKDPRVQANASYLAVIVLSRVVTRLGSLETVTPAVIEELFVEDLEYLQGLYERANGQGRSAVDVTCPDCGEAFAVEVETRGPTGASGSLGE